jgi:transposase-like protein
MQYSSHLTGVQKKCIIFAMGIRGSGNYEILGFYMNTVENDFACGNILMDLHERSVEEPLFIHSRWFTGNRGRNKTAISKS